MKIVIAPDSFKDSLSAMDVASAIENGVVEVLPHAEIVKCPMADGGEGTVDSILSALKGNRRTSMVCGPLGNPVRASWGWLPDSKTAIIEMAEASGLQLVPIEERDACRSSTFGTGELIVDALNLGATTIILTVGGSATNDGGAGMLKALGVGFYDANYAELPLGGLALSKLARIETGRLNVRLQGVEFKLASDVDNPLCGLNGASHIFGPQKGATEEQVLLLDAALGHFADVCQSKLKVDHRDRPGSGAAGGVGFAARAFLKASFRPGIELVAELTELAEHVMDADLVITGEGQFDSQTLRGKTPLGVARIAKQHGVPVIVLAGTLGEGYADIYSEGIDSAFSIVSGPMPLDRACGQASRLLRERARDLARVLEVGARLGASKTLRTTSRCDATESVA